MLDTVVETTATVKARAELSLLNRELGHRLKNTLAVVQALALQTMKGHGDPAAIAAFGERLNTLARSHDVLQHQGWVGAPILRLIESALSAFGNPTQFHISGPDVMIGPNASTSFSLVLHELATNAVKYGALSVITGQVIVKWTVKDEVLLLRWRETGGPHVAEPTHKGFGTRLVDSVWSGKSAIWQYSSGGLEVDLEIPLSAMDL
jgi:two-component sensor histidine kinase